MKDNYSLINELNNELEKPSAKDFGWVLYRFPNSEDVYFNSGKVRRQEIESISSQSFIIAPFQNHDHLVWQIDSTLISKFDKYGIFDAITNLPFYFNPKKSETTSEIDYCTLVEKVLNAIDSKQIEKAVPARIKYIKKDQSFSPLSFYRSLLDNYPNAFVYILSTPGTGTWIGCTPELLLNAKGTAIKTLSLAGTKKNNDLSANEMQELFSNKELNEQAIVTGYINDILEKYTSEIVKEGPELIKAGNVFHLATYFNGVLKPSYANNYGALLKELHPTPAVCGFPLKESLNILLGQEKFERNLYSGYLGPITDKSADIYVNLRCMQVFNNELALYAGAGVVEGSVPEKEWLETEEKLNTLLKFF